MSVIERLLRAGEGKTLRRLQGIAAQVNAVEEDFERLTDAELRAETDTFRARLADGETLDDILPEAFAAVREASRRTIGIRVAPPTSTTSDKVAAAILLSRSERSTGSRIRWSSPAAASSNAAPTSTASWPSTTRSRSARCG